MLLDGAAFTPNGDLDSSVIRFLKVIPNIDDKLLLLSLASA